MSKWSGFVVGLAMAITLVMTVMRPADVALEDRAIAGVEQTAPLVAGRATPGVGSRRTQAASISAIDTGPFVSAPSIADTDTDAPAPHLAADTEPRDTLSPVTQPPADAAQTAAPPAAASPVHAPRPSTPFGPDAAPTENGSAAFAPAQDSAPATANAAANSFEAPLPEFRWDAATTSAPAPAAALTPLPESRIRVAALPDRPRPLTTDKINGGNSDAPVAGEDGADGLGGSGATTDGTAADARRWFAFWQPFTSALSAEGFSARLGRITGLDYRVVQVAPGQYHVAFAYDDEPGRERNLAAIEAATGLSLRGSSL